MLRSAAKRLLINSLHARPLARSITRPAVLNWARFCTSNHNHNPNPSPNLNVSPNQFEKDRPGESAAQASGFSGAEEEARSSEKRRAGGVYKEEQARVLRASLRHVNRLGWTEAAMMAGAREVGVSPSIVGSFPRKEAELVEYFMDECLEKLIDTIEADTELKNLIPSERVSKLVKIRLEMQVPYISKWAQALSIQALPVNLPTSFRQRAMLVDEIWHAAGDDSTDIDWYVKRTVLGGIYSTTEVYMLTDNSPEFRDTWTFLNARVRDAFDLKKTLQETQYLADAVSAGLGNPLQGLMKEVFKR